MYAVDIRSCGKSEWVFHAQESAVVIYVRQEIVSVVYEVPCTHFHCLLVLILRVMLKNGNFMHKTLEEGSKGKHAIKNDNRIKINIFQFQCVKKQTYLKRSLKASLSLSFPKHFGSFFFYFPFCVILLWSHALVLCY